MKNLSLSIVITTFNRKKKLKRLIESIKFQKKLNIELVIVNDGSKDNTREYLTLIKKKLKNKVKIIHQQNLGRSISLFKGILKSTKKFLMIMDDDDYFFKDSFAIIKKKLFHFSDKKINFLVFDVSNNKKNYNLNKINNKNLSYLSIRNDYKFLKDFKEIVRTEQLRKKILKRKKLFFYEKRIPTGLIWALMEKKNDAIFLNKKIIKKNYHADGLTAQSKYNKLKNPYSMRMMYSLYLKSKSYSSISSRFVFKILYHRYYLHSKFKNKIKFKDLSFFYPISFILYLFDSLYLLIKKKYE